MNKVITINLNGKAYQLEEAGYEALRAYLDQAAAKLAGNPDKDEIMADFEQAIADKCDQYLNASKNVVTTADIEAIIAKMGPVDASGTGASDTNAGTEEKNRTGGASSTAGSAKPKRLYRVPEGEWLMGICNGIAAYFNIDVAIVRILFVLFTLITHIWIGILIYIILAIVIPVARTDDEKAYARGAMPFNASDFIQQATTRYAEFQKDHPNMPPAPTDPHDRESWKKWKEEMKAWKQRMKEWEREQRQEIRRKHREHNGNRHAWQNRSWQNSPWQNDASMAATAGMGFFRFLMGLVIAGLTVLWILAIISIARHGTVFGLAIAAGHPLWMPIVFITALFVVVVMPFKLLLRNAFPHPWNRYSFFADLMQSIFFVFAIYLLVWTGRELFPVVNEAWSVVWNYISGFRI